MAFEGVEENNLPEKPNKNFPLVKPPVVIPKLEEFQQQITNALNLLQPTPAVREKIQRSVEAIRINCAAFKFSSETARAMDAIASDLRRLESVVPRKLRDELVRANLEFSKVMEGDAAMLLGICENGRSTKAAPVSVNKPNAAKLNPKVVTRGRKPSIFKASRWRIIRQVFKKDPSVKGRKFWERVEAEGVFSAPDWRANGCPKKLSDAFDDAKWQRKLNADKSRATHDLRK